MDSNLYFFQSDQRSVVLEWIIIKHCRNVAQLFWARKKSYRRLVFSVYSVVKRCSAGRHAYVLGGRSTLCRCERTLDEIVGTASCSTSTRQGASSAAWLEYQQPLDAIVLGLLLSRRLLQQMPRRAAVDVLTKAIHDASVYRISQNHDRAIDGRPPTTSGDVTILSCSYTLTVWWLFVRN